MAKPKQVDFVTLRGKVYYARVLGDPMDDYEATQGRGDGKEWKLDFVPLKDADWSRLRKLGIGDRIKAKDDYLDGETHITLRQRTALEVVEDEDGTKRKKYKNRIRVVDVTGEAWPQDKMLGNETIVDVKLRIADYGKGMKKGVYINGLRVLELVPYVRPLFDELDEDDPYYQKANAASQQKRGRNEEVEDDEPEDEPEGDTNADPADVDEDEPEPERKPPARRRKPIEDDLDDDIPF